MGVCIVGYVRAYGPRVPPNFVIGGSALVLVYTTRSAVCTCVRSCFSLAETQYWASRLREYDTAIFLAIII